MNKESKIKKENRLWTSRISRYSLFTIPNSTPRGFTLLETFVAITILMFAVVGPLTIVSKALNASYDSRDQITAFYLAQDAIEYIRNVRD